jgi:acid phosphatase (class A)
LLACPLLLRANHWILLEGLARDVGVADDGQLFLETGNLTMTTRKLTLALSILLLVAGGNGNAFAAGMNYLTGRNIDLTKLLPPPPPADSEAQKQDMNAVLEIQRKRTPKQIERALADNVISIWRYNDVLGPKFKAENLPVMNKFLERAQADARAILTTTKEAWNRPRPVFVNSEVDALGGKPRLPSGYPSGTGLAGALTGIMLANMIPEKRFELFERSAEFLENRVVIGQHYPRDIVAGRIGATVLAAAFFESPAFVKDFDAARAELRNVLELGEPVIARQPDADDDIITGSVKPQKPKPDVGN